MAIDSKVVISVEDLKKYYPVKSGIVDTILRKEKKNVKAIDGITFNIYDGEIIGIAGESGSGKTTTGEIITQLQETTDGKVFYNDMNIDDMSKNDVKNFRKACQMIFQDPYETLNPRFTIRRSIEEPLLINGWKDEKKRLEKVRKALELAELRPVDKYLSRFPHELSGGQRQRVAIARGIVLDPKLLIADEPVSMLDVSIRAGILNLLIKLRDEMGLTMVYVSHDLSTIKYICNRTIIMYLGKIVEIGPTEEVIDKSSHPYTQALIASVPIPDPEVKRKKAKVDDELPDQIDLPKGCRFWPRCPEAFDRCKKEEPSLYRIGEGHYAACFLRVNFAQNGKD